MMSGTPDQESFREAIAQEAKDWIGKPIDVEVLKYKLTRMFRA